MNLGRIRHMPIVDGEGRLLGLVTHRDLLAAGDDPARKISDVMQTDVKTISPDTPAHEAAYLLLRYAIGCVPVIDDDSKLVGIVTEVDFVRAAYTLLGGRVPIDQLELEEKEAEQV
jgi:CBS domain-containing protein